MPLLPSCFRSKPRKTVAPDKYARDAEAWITHGKIIYQAARALFDAGDAYPSLYFSAATLGHSALEVLMKGILIGEGMVSFDPRRIKQLPEAVVLKRKDCVWDHSLLALARKLEQQTDFDLDEEMHFHNILYQPPFPVRKALEHFEPFFEELRYPHQLENTTGFGAGDELVLEELVVRILALKRT